MRLLLLLVLAFTSVTGAQEKPPRVATSFYCFQYAPGLEDVFVRTGAKAFQKIELSTANMIGPVSIVSIDGVVTVHRQDTDEDGNMIYPVAGTAKVSGGVSKPLVLLLPGGEQAGYRTLVMDRSNARFPMGSYQFVNLARFPVRGLIGKTPVAVRSGGVSNIKPAGDPGEMVTVLFEYNDGTRWRTMTKTRWAIRDDRRTLMCSYVDPRTQRVKLRSIPERLVPAEPQP